MAASSCGQEAEDNNSNEDKLLVKLDFPQLTLIVV
jgi:hypothetical protein